MVWARPGSSQELENPSRSLTLETGAQAPGPLSVAFPGVGGAGLQVKQMEPVPTWDAGVTGSGGLACCAVTLVLQSLLEHQKSQNVVTDGFFHGPHQITSFILSH